MRSVAVDEGAADDDGVDRAPTKAARGDLDVLATADRPAWVL
jgi:hypothetical protein